MRKRSRDAVILVSVVVVLLMAGALVRNLADGGQASASDPGPVHVHGLGVNPADGSLFIATHTGLFKLSESAQKAERVADRYQDTMGFSVRGPNHFLGSGHPDARERELPPLLGLIASTDAGNTWRPISLQGEADFHVLRSIGRQVYGYDASNDRLLASADEGQSWEERGRPAGIVDLVPNPNDPQQLVATAVGGRDRGLYTSPDGGRSWRRLGGTVGLLAWPTRERLYIIGDGGRTMVGSADGRLVKARGEVGGQPAAFLAVGRDELYVALHDGTIKRSIDGGRSWIARFKP